MNITSAEVDSTEGVASPQALWRRYRLNSDSATEGSLIEEYLPLVRTTVGRLAMTLPAHVSQEDLNSAGLVGLLQAVRSYDPSAGAAFATYARFRVRGAIFDEMRRMDWVPRLIHDKSRKVQNTIATLEQQLGRTPTEGETARALGLSAAEYEKWMEEIRPVTFVCLDSTGQTQEEGGTLHEQIVDDSQEDPADVASRNEMRDLIFERLQQLPDMQKKVLSLYYVEGLRLREIAEAFGLTESRISQIHSQAILSLRAYMDRREAGSVMMAGSRA